MRTSGISSPFGGLSRSPGQVPHVLLTRSPLGLPQCCHCMDLVRLACVRHAASVRPEPGSNSPSRSEAVPRGRRPSIGLKSRSYAAARLGPFRLDWSSRPIQQCELRVDGIDVNDLSHDLRDHSREPTVARTGFSSSLPFSRSAGSSHTTPTARARCRCRLGAARRTLRRSAHYRDASGRNAPRESRPIGSVGATVNPASPGR